MFSVLGIDIGSVAISAALIDENKNILNTDYAFHYGAIKENLREILSRLDLSSLGGIAATTSTPDILVNSHSYDTQISIINAVKHFHADVGSILFIGGENFGLIKFNDKGEYESYRTNSSCAAGTGTFLDQQAKRLNLSDSKSLSEIACSNRETSLKIATRCAVFAKTDLIHAQQQGYSLGQISDGLCQGLAKNVIDTLIPDESTLQTPLIFAGGVSMNHAVIKHINHFLKIKPVVDKYSHLFGALGAAFSHLEERKLYKIEASEPSSIIQNIKKEKIFGFKPLEIKLSLYPEFSSEHKYKYTPAEAISSVEVDIYGSLKSENEVYMGMDIGSTSTKAVLMDKSGNVLAGLYTSTSGQPIKATQAIFAAIDDIAKNRQVNFTFSAVGTTGSGRKYLGKVLNADLMVDEITAHARAAYELNHEVNTIIEIGGQDAKFTTMENGMVTFSVMNNVCAAGTGSFIEEQAQKLGCSLSDYADRAFGTPAPVSSDRCTVFMERDINHYLVDGYSVNEVLASVLHSVCENYLTKIAKKADIGDNICFQGATAKNRALVAAFEQKLQKPIFVSRFCHLTGALGSALILAENKISQSKFRGISIYKDQIPVLPEVCELCNNHCKINKVSIKGETIAFGFLCGRDYDTKRYVTNKRNVFDLVKERRKIFTLTNTPKELKSDLILGIPASLFLSEEGIIWKHFFNTLGVRTISSENLKNPVKKGKNILTSEFCAPLSAFFGHVKYLAEKSDYLFLPIYLETREKEKDKLRQYCYYSQYASCLITSVKSLNLKDRAIMPVIDPGYFLTTMELNKILKPILNCGYWSIYFAFQRAMDFYKDCKENLKNVFQREFERTDDISILFVGRPYTVLENNMNKGIPDIFAAAEIKTYYQDMLTYSREDLVEVEDLLKAFHWNYASKIIESTLVAAKTRGLYPVYITSFKCGPDSFAIGYFKRIMDKYQKPYLVLELDEHDSSVGYETRIEAAVRSFRNHFSKLNKDPVWKSSLPLIPRVDRKIDGKTLLIPCWDSLTTKLLEAILIKEGIDARMVPLTEKAIKLGPRTNTGMCIPVNIIIQSFADYIAENYLDPEQTAVWMFESKIACNIRLYPYFIKSVLEAEAKGLEKVSVYLGQLAFSDISYQVTIDSYFAHMFGGMLRKMGCKIRPYEKEKGLTDKIITQSLAIFYNTFLGSRNKEDDVIKVVNLFKKIENTRLKRPKIAVLGDIYVRDNDVFNQYLIRCIESFGGEVITTPFSDLAKTMADPFIRRSIKIGAYKEAFATKAIMAMVNSLEKNHYRHFNEILNEPQAELNSNYELIFELFNLKTGHSGESADNLVHIFSLKRHYPDISLFVHANPAFCSAGLVTDALAPKIEELTGIPMVSINYDGTNKNQNQKLVPYIKFARGEYKTTMPPPPICQNQDTKDVSH
ncbi:MAG: acyl-CoA dehydratase activase [bacterium]